MNEKQNKLLLQMLQSAQGGAVQPDELKQVVDFILDIIAQVKEKVDTEIETKHNMSMAECEYMLSEIKTIEKNVTDIFNSKAITENASLTKVSELSSSISNLQNTLSKYDGKIEELRDIIPDLTDVELDTPEQIRDKLETLKGDNRLDESAIRGLDERLKKIESVSTQGGGISLFGGGRQMRMVSFAFTGDGVTTTFALPKTPGAKGLAIWTYYQGQYQQLNTHYTVSNKTLTTVGWTPAVDSVLEGYLII